MKKIDIGKSGIMGSEVALGCMRMNDLSVGEAARVIDTAYGCGINYFDHADIYGDFCGISEERFAAALKETDIERGDIILQTKCGIRGHSSGSFNYYDFSYEHITDSVNGSLERLKTDYVDVLLLHRPDTLMEPDEVAKAFDRLESEGKVRHFGVSNQHPMHIELLKKTLNQKLIANQLQFSPVHTGMINCGMEVNVISDGAAAKDGYVLEYSRLCDMTIQAWSPYQYGVLEGVFLLNEAFAPLNAVIKRIAAENGVQDSAVVAAWILRHPANMQIVPGSMNAERIAAICKGSELELSREEWYEIYHSAGNIIP